MDFCLSYSSLSNKNILGRGLKRGDLEFIFLKRGGFTYKGGSWTILLRRGYYSRKRRLL